MRSEKEIKEAIEKCIFEIEHEEHRAPGGELARMEWGVKITALKDKLSVLHWVLGSKWDSLVDGLVDIQD